jgi:hypothetical protein
MYSFMRAYVYMYGHMYVCIYARMHDVLGDKHVRIFMSGDMLVILGHLIDVQVARRHILFS